MYPITMIAQIQQTLSWVSSKFLKNTNLGKIWIFKYQILWIGCLELMDNKAYDWVLCISTSKRVLCIPFACRNPFFNAKQLFAYSLVNKCLFCSVSDGKSCFRVVSTIIFCVLFVLFSYCGDCYQLSISDVIVVQKKFLWRLKVDFARVGL